MVMESMKEQKGTRGNNKASFTKDGINGSKFEKWTEEETHKMIDKLERWMMPVITLDEDGEIETIEYDPDRIFFKDFLLAHKLYNSWLRYVCDKHETVSKRIDDIKEMQEQLIVRASARGKIKERTAQFILMQWYDWRTKTDNANMDMTPVVFEVTKTYENKK